MTDHPIAIIGAGPVGLAAAAHLAERGERFIVLEAGDGPGTTVREWAHVRLFSPWSYVVDDAARRLLESTGWVSPNPDGYPTGGALVEHYLEPLAQLPQIAPSLRTRSRVAHITRAGADKLWSADRDQLPFELVVDGPAGRGRLRARAVIDATGTWHSPNPIGSDGLPVDGEAELAAHITQRIPDAGGVDRDRYAGRSTLVIGAGHSAFNAILDLVHLADDAADTRITWAIRGQATGRLFGGGVNDTLARRGALGTMVQGLVESGRVRLITDFRTTSLERRGDTVVVYGTDPSGTTREIGPFDEVVALTGFRPDHSLTSELRVSFDPTVEATPALAPLIDPNLHSCGTVRPHGAADLAHPERGYYAVGMKSYGRAPTFLMLTGYEQVRSVVAELVGDHEAAARVELVLPETGVCSTDALAGEVRELASVGVAGSAANGSPAGGAAPLADTAAGTRTELPQAQGQSQGGCCG
jgi:thioredoxin reductase